MMAGSIKIHRSKLPVRLESIMRLLSGLRRLGAACIATFVIASSATAQEVATPVDSITLLPGFKAELLYSVPRDQQGSWVSLCTDHKGRLITSDQYGSLYRITVSEPGKEPAEVSVEKIELPADQPQIGMAQGLLYAFDSLYVVVNSANDKQPSGLYRLRDTDNDDKYDKVEKLREFGNGYEHGAHAVVLSPDKQYLYICAGNHTKLCDPERSLVPRNWGEDFLLSRLWDAGGHAQGILAPGGWICRTDPDGKVFELVASGFRNEYDIAFSPDGELFTYDADMEWDIGLPWYRPTRVNHVISGAEFGWRSGTGKWPADYPDSLGSVVDIGNGSPTGITFGTGAKFPAKYQKALFISDWSYGIIYAVHMSPQGAGFTGVAEKFASAQPLPVTDLVVHPTDGSLYVTIGGRKTQSGLYRLTYTGAESTELATAISKDDHRAERAERYSLEQLHGSQSPYAIDLAWPKLSSPDRETRFAARIAIEHQPVSQWAEKALAEKDPVSSIQAIIALARCGEPAQQDAALAALNRIDWNKLTEAQRVDLLRAYQLVFIRFGKGTDAARQSVIAKLDGLYPNPSPRLNLELGKQLVYLEAPGVVARTLALFDHAPTQEEQIACLFTLMEMKADWTTETRKKYFEDFATVAASRGGHSFMGYLKNIRQAAIDSLTDDEKTALKDVIDKPFAPVEQQGVSPTRKLVKKWTVDELVPVLDKGLHDRDFVNGRAMFSAAACFKCHRVKLEGGSTGPDLTGAGGRFNNRNLLESMIEPGKVISDQYEKKVFQMKDGRVIEGRVINLNEKNMMVLTNMFDPDSIVPIDRNEIEESKPSKASMMPDDLLNTLNENDILDLAAYLKSGGDPNSPLFKKRTAAK
jgi:putative heme-binding domain-containing protein